MKLKTRNLVTIKMSSSVSLSFALLAVACYANALYPVIMSKLSGFLYGTINICR